MTETQQLANANQTIEVADAKIVVLLEIIVGLKEEVSALTALTTRLEAHILELQANQMMMLEGLERMRKTVLRVSK